MTVAKDRIKGSTDLLILALFIHSWVDGLVVQNKINKKKKKKKRKRKRLGDTIFDSVVNRPRRHM